MDFLTSFMYEEDPSLWDRLHNNFNSGVHVLLPYAVTLYWYVFFTLLVVATVGRKLRLRRFYIQVLDKLFYVAAVKMEEHVTKKKIQRRISSMDDETEESESECDLEKPDSNIHNVADRCKYYAPTLKQDSRDNEHIDANDKLKYEKEKSINQTSKSPGSSWEDLNIGSEPNLNAQKMSPIFENNSYELDFPGIKVKETSLNTDTIANASQSCKNELADDIENCNPKHSNNNNTTESPTQQPNIKDYTEDTETSHPVVGDARDVRFPLDAPMLCVSAGIRAIVDDCVSNSFSPEQLKTWNLMSRTIQHNESIRPSNSIAVFFVVGLLFRYLFLMPMRVVVLCLSLGNLAVCNFLVGCLPSGPFKRTVNSYVVSWGFDFVAGSLSVVARFHNKENRPSHGIAVANHTSPIDGMVLATDNCYDMVGQKTKGLLGMFMNSLAKSSGHIWFDRFNSNDRQATTRLLTSHAQNNSLPPILMFPEGVCVNNTAMLQFRKGAFEVDCDIYPVAIRFDPLYGDAFWNEGDFASYCFSMMTSWAIVCDVFYLPPMRKGAGESASCFANRVRSCIAQKAGLLELEWNSIVKLCVMDTDRWINLMQERQMKQQKHIAMELSLDGHNTEQN